MVRVTVLFPNEEGKKFDHDYFQNKHLPMVARLLTPLGMVSGGCDKGISGPDPSAPPPYALISHLEFNTVDEVHEAFKAAGREVMGDVPNFTDISPVIQISEIAV